MDDIGPEVFQDTSESPEVTCVCQYIKVPLQPKFNGLNPQGVGLLTDTLQILFWRSPVRKEHLVPPQAQPVGQLQGVLGRPCPLPVTEEVEDFHFLFVRSAFYFRTISTTFSITCLIVSFARVPARYNTIWLSAVKIRLGLKLLGCFKPPSAKSLS